MKHYQTALILGYGRSGRAAERMLHAEGCETVVLTRETAGEAEVLRLLAERSFDVCIVSPGFALGHPWTCAVQAAGIPLLSELELGWSRFGGKTVALTGSNGKSTAVKWIGDMLRLDGRTAAVGGNYGIPACEVVLNQPGLEWLVLEVSSFQLETVRDFRAEIAVVLNVLPNHLDRHGNMETYSKAKARVFGPSSYAGDVCIVPEGLLPAFRADVAGDRDWITFGGASPARFHFENGRVFDGLVPVLDLSGTMFDSPILGSCTGAAVAAVAAAAGVPFAIVERAARELEPLPHRIQRIGAFGGVVFVNDSKATNLAAMATALHACGRGIHLIAGGLPKESDYTLVKEILAERVRSIYLIGQASRAMYHAWNGICPCVECGSLEGAFSAARHAARAGETILLSPGCASFDQFRSFEERGERFSALFHELMVGGDAS